MKQLTELLKSRDLTCDELGLLYCYKHGVSTNQALKTIGIDAKLAALSFRCNIVVPNVGIPASLEMRPIRPRGSPPFHRTPHSPRTSPHLRIDDLHCDALFEIFF